MKALFVSIVRLLLMIAAVAACAPAVLPPSPAADSRVAAVRDVYVYKSPTCSCCHEWESYLQDNGFTVNSIPTVDMSAIKSQMGVPETAWSCHTAVIGGYVVEGHVPIEAIRDLLAQGPDIDGIALPGMPAGSPGMTGVKAGPFSVLAIQNGNTSAFGSY